MNDNDIFDPGVDLEEFDDDFGDELDLSELVQVTETAEQLYAANTITFVPPEETDPTPPPALPEDTPSFHPLDVENLRTWIYPTNYQVRGYQFNILQKAMFTNTLVALPTGLGKTFIAAVVMFNYWRWFPNSKIIFMAPTRPLVTQQIEACFTICGLPQQDTVDISGSTSPEKRIEFWKTKRVFFSTPQTVDNDLNSNSCPGEKIVCLVVDEAHKATGNYSYVKVIRKLAKKNKHFRVLALTATPGSNLMAVQNVVTNLQIANIQIRTEDSMDIREFSHGKNTESIVVPLSYTEGSTGLLPRIIDEYKTQVFEPMLLQLSKHPTGVQPDADKNPAFGLNMKRTQFQVQASNINNGLKFKITSMFLVAEQMSRAYDLLCQHGISPFIESIEGTRREAEATMAVGKSINKAQAQFYNHAYIVRMIPRLKQEMQKPDFIGHPKIDTLVGLLLKHFANIAPGEASKVMVFSSYRSSVSEICNVLNRHNPMIRPYHFVGQAEGKNGLKGLKQSEQQEVIRKFKNDEFNVIVCTSIGEEGLDIGEVDLIICYDSQSSPIRMLQRMGRTGRKRQGKCVLLMTESEEQKFKKAKEGYAEVQRLITRGTNLNYFKPNPTVIPKNYKPALCRKRIEIGQYKAQEKKKSRVRVVSNMSSDGFLNDSVENAFVKSFSNGEEQYTSVTQVMEKYWPNTSARKSLGKQIPLQTKLKTSHFVGHSRRTLDFVQLIEKMEHRILYPDEEIRFTTPKKQTRLIIPSKAKPSSSKLILPPKRKPRQDDLASFYNTNAPILDRDLGFESDGFLNNNHSEDIDFAESSTKRSINDFFLPRKKAKISSVSSVSEKSISLGSIDDINFPDLDDLLDHNFDSNEEKYADKSKGVSKGKAADKSKGTHTVKTIDKGKGVDKGKSVDRGFNMVDSVDNNKILKSDHEEFFGNGAMKAVGEFDMIDNCDMEDDWEPMLPESVYDDIKPDKEPSRPPILPESSEQLIVTTNDNPLNESVTILDMDEIYNVQTDDEDFGFDDFPLDDLFSKGSAAWTVVNAGAFDEILPAVFPFEKEQSDIDDNNIMIVWSQSAPNFSQKALELLEKRQNAMKHRTGKFLTMNIIANYNASSLSSQTSKVPLIQFQTPQLQSRTPQTNPRSPQINYNELHSSLKVPSPQVDIEPITTEARQEIFEIPDDDDDDDDDFGINDSFLQQAVEFLEEAPKKDTISISDDKSVAEEGFDSIVYEGGEFANLFGSQNEQEIQDFSFEEQPFESQKYDYQMKKRAALYDCSSSLIMSDNSESKYSDTLSYVKSPSPALRQTSTIHGSPARHKGSLLESMANDFNTPSPLRDMQAFNRAPSSLIIAGESEDDEFPIRRKKRARISPSQQVVQRTKKRLKQKGTPEVEVDGDDEVVMYEGIKSTNFMEKIRQCQDTPAIECKPKMTSLTSNPFFDVEAEKSSDEGHTTDGESEGEEEGSSLMNSFIDDENSSLHETLQRNTNVDIYRQSLLDDDMPKKHWINRFDAEKWLNAEDDSIIGGEDSFIEGDDEDECAAGNEVEQHDSKGFLQDLLKLDDDDDFM